MAALKTLTIRNPALAVLLAKAMDGGLFAQVGFANDWPWLMPLEMGSSSACHWHA